MSNLRRKMLSISSQNNNNNNNNNNSDNGGQKFYLFQNGSLQNGAEIMGNSFGNYSRPIIPGEKNDIIADGGIMLYGGTREIGIKTAPAEYPAAKYTYDEAFRKFYNDVIIKHFPDGTGYRFYEISYSQGTKEDWDQGGWGFWAESTNYETVTGGECTLYFDEKTDFDITKYKTINFLTTDIDKVENAKGSLVLTQNYKPPWGPNDQTPEKKADRVLIEFLEKNDGIKNAALNDNTKGYNAFKFTCNVPKGTAYKITEIYLQE